MALAPFLICACIALALLVLGGLVTFLHLIGLDGLILPAYCIGILAALPLAFLSAVRIGRHLLDDGGRKRNV
jgi:hypothetical protein